MRRTLATLLAGGVIVAAAAGPTLAGDREDWEPLIFELTLAGDVDPDDTFAIVHLCLDGDAQPECIFIHGSTPVCTGEEWGPDWGLEPCVARTYQGPPTGGGLESWADSR
jgi:hypothetical protein